MRIVFMGTPEFAVPSLQALIDNSYKIAGVFTQPDRPVGRGRKITPPPIKELALANKIPVFQPQHIRKDGISDLISLKPDVCVTVAFGQILSRKVLEIPPLGTINVHASLLPRHRGCAPIQYAILQGEKKTGITTMLTEVGIDTGDILLQEELKIRDDENAEELSKRLSKLGSKVLIDTLKELERGDLKPVPQVEEDSTYDSMLTREMGRIDFNKTTIEILNHIRALVPWPGAYVDTPFGRLKVWEASKAELKGEAGVVLVADAKQGLIMGTKDGSISFEVIQMPCCPRMGAKDYLMGNRLNCGECWLEDEHDEQ